MTVKRVITMDAHKEHCEIGVFHCVHGKPYLRSSETVETSIPSLRECFRRFPGKRTLVFEEGTLAAWLRRHLAADFEEVIVCDPRRNALIHQNPAKSDRLDVKHLAELYASGQLQAVYHTDDLERQRFKDLVLHYHDTAKSVARYKNKIKAKYLSRGLKPAGNSAYLEPARRRWLRRARAEGEPIVLENLCAALDQAQKQKAKLRLKLAQRGKKFPALKLLLRVPMVGWITAATFFAVIDTPWRFANVKRLWHYCGVAVGQRTSAGKWLSRPQLLPQGNRLLRYVLLQAAANAAGRGARQPFGEYYQRVRRTVKTDAAARNATARKIAAVLWGIWKNRSAFDETYVN